MIDEFQNAMNIISKLVAFACVEISRCTNKTTIKLKLKTFALRKKKSSYKIVRQYLFLPYANDITVHIQILDSNVFLFLIYIHNFYIFVLSDLNITEWGS